MRLSKGLDEQRIAGRELALTGKMNVVEMEKETALDVSALYKATLQQGYSDA